MIILRNNLEGFTGETVLTIGNFDGIHVGHQRLIEKINERARTRGVKSGMVTFEPHPWTVLKPDNAPPLLTTLPEKLALLEHFGIDLVALLTFSEALMRTRAADFLRMLEESLQPRELWVGADFAMGYKREGNIAFIREWAAPRGIEVHTVPLVTVEGEVVSASRIRSLIAEGRVEQAARLLGRPPSVRGEVQLGDQRGRTIGFPTANILPPAGRLIPANGVYVTQTVLPSGEVVPSVTNVGTRPTFDGQRRQVESHLFDWSGDLYGQTLEVRFLERLRAEQKFAGLEALVAQIQADAEQAKERLARDG